jgi:lipopolysaccharide/colanic/teichoic acid biosynthesis glycosyltransferase
MPAKSLAPPGEPRVQFKPLVLREGPPVLLPRPSRYLACKRGLDLVAVLILMVPALPLILLSVLLVKLSTRGPAFYSQIRLGQGGRPFRIYKVRTMIVDSEKDGACWSAPGDPRVTPIGRFLRATHLDELPQVWNVLRGDMSLVGPRPERPEFVPSLEQAVPRYRDRLLLRPGLTGLAQVQLPPDTDLESVRRKLACDLFYARKLGLWLDLRLIFVTGFYLLGFSTWLPQWLLRIPRGAVIENHYRHLVEETASTGARLPVHPVVNGNGHARHPV